MEILGERVFQAKEKAKQMRAASPWNFLKTQGDQYGWRETKKNKVMRDDIRKIMEEKNTMEPGLV